VKNIIFILYSLLLTIPLFASYSHSDKPSKVSANGKIRVEIAQKSANNWYSMTVDIYDNETGEKLNSIYKPGGTCYYDFSISHDGSKITVTDSGMYKQDEIEIDISAPEFSKSYDVKINNDFNSSIGTIDSLYSFLNKYKSDGLFSKHKEIIQKAKKILTEKVLKTDIIKNVKKFVSIYPNIMPKEFKDLLNKLYQKEYQKVEKENNIAGYEWFIKTYSKAPQVKEAISKIHELAFEEAEDIDTISSYNTFIIAYPTATHVKQANEEANDLEYYKYIDTLPSWLRAIMPDFLASIFTSVFGIFSSDEKKSRALLIKAKQVERAGNEYYGSKRAGYVIITNRMYDLLQKEYDDTDATLRHLESQEFKDFVRTFKSVMRSISSQLDNISRYSSEILEVSKKGFSDANADRDMSEYYNEKHREWEKNMHLRDKGYN
jgi:hypothetical protein